MREALNGIPDVYYWKADAIKLVPIGQMPAVVSIQATRTAFAKGQFVRLMRGHYKGDLAQVSLTVARFCGFLLSLADALGGFGTPLTPLSRLRSNP